MEKGGRFKKAAHIADEGGFLFPGKLFWGSLFTSGGRNGAVKGFAEGKSGHEQVLITCSMLISGV
jgi:hypothetical protein